MLLDYKISYILSKESDFYAKINSRLTTKLSIEGNADVKSLILIKAIVTSLKLGYITYNIKLELYKKLLYLLRLFGLMYRIPDPREDAETNPALYWGAGNAGLNVAQLQSLVIDHTEFVTQVAFNYTLTEEVYYFCYPTSLGDLISILDNNGFETLPGWTKRSGSFVFAGLPNVDYNIYEFNNITTQTSFTNTFIR